MGLPYMLLGMAARTIRLPKAGAWMVWIKHALGLALVGLGLYFLRPLIPHELFRWMAVLGFAAAGVFLGWLDRPDPFGARSHGGFVIARTIVGAGLIALAAVLVPRPSTQRPGVAWQPFTAAALEQAAQSGTPAIVDVYADWCIPCIELDHVTFRDPQVIQRLDRFARLRIDLTGEAAPEARALLERYDLFGVPTVLLFGPDGAERPDLRITGFVPPAELLRRLDRLAAPPS
jgi:thiol:disulfide interchange protein DsbD